MHLIRSITLAAIACSFAESFIPPVPNTVQPAHPNGAVELRATADTEAERLLRKVRELRKEAKAGEDELHTTLIQRKKTRDAATDSTIAQLFPIVKAADGDVVDGGDGVCALCDRLRERRLAADVLVRVVERLHEREVAARGLEHVEPSVHHDQVTFVRVAQPDEAELRKVQGLVDRLIEAAEVLDGEFIEEKSECNGRITHSDILHWGGGNIAGILKDKVKDLGRAHDEQFLKRLESFKEAAKRKHSRDEFNRDSWRDGDVWSP